MSASAVVRARTRRVLLVTYYWPPIGGAGGQRPSRLANHLIEHGYSVTVLTGRGATPDRWTPEDQALASDLAEDLDVRRVNDPEPTRGGTSARVERLLGIRDPWTRWWHRAVAHGIRASAAECDLVWVSMQPYQSAHPTGDVCSELGLPWVADLADPWALDEMLLYPSALHRRMAVGQMRRALSSAAGVIMSTSEAARRLVDAFPELGDRPIGVGPHGWERKDFGGPSPRAGRSVFTIVHTGYLHTELGRRQAETTTFRRFLGGGRDGAQILARSHLYLVEAIRRLINRRPDLHGRIELHLAGVQTGADREVVAGVDFVRMLGYLDHVSSIGLLRSAHLLFLPMHDLPPGTRAGLVPGKTYEYLASGRPILAAVPDGDARDILREAGNASLCRPSDVEGMASALSQRVDAFLAGEDPPPPARKVVERYEYSRLAGEMAAFFDEIVSGDGARESRHESRVHGSGLPTSMLPRQTS